MKHIFLFTLGIGLILAGCSSYSYRPILYNNAKYKKVGQMEAEKQVDLCLAEADSFLKGPKAIAFKQSLKRSLTTGAILGGVIGTGTGRFSGVAGGAAAGAGIGAGAALIDEAVKDKLTPDQLKSRYVLRCLNDKGFEVIGWM